MRTGVIAALVLVAGLAAAPAALACHPCVIGEPCPPHAGCGGSLLEWRLAVVFTAGSGDDATRWTLFGRPSRIQPLSPLPGLFVRGSIRCQGPACVGRRGRFEGRLDSLNGFALGSRFRNGARCEFVHDLEADRYRCDGADFQFSVIGSATIDEYVAPPPPGPVVPQEVTSRQAHAALILRGYDTLIDQYIDAIADPVDRKLTRNEYEQSAVFERHRPLVLEIGAALSLDLDELFIYAASLP